MFYLRDLRTVISLSGSASGKCSLERLKGLQDVLEAGSVPLAFPRVFVAPEPEQPVRGTRGLPGGVIARTVGVTHTKRTVWAQLTFLLYEFYHLPSFFFLEDICISRRCGGTGRNIFKST